MSTPLSERNSMVEWVDEDIIRRFFNEGQFYQKALRGEIPIFLKRNNHCENPPEGHPVCTRSQIFYYYDNEGQDIAVVHQYLLPDGTIGGSGVPDPKKLVLEGRVIATRTKK